MESRTESWVVNQSSLAAGGICMFTHIVRKSVRSIMAVNNIMDSQKIGLIYEHPSFFDEWNRVRGWELDKLIGRSEGGQC